jgi:pyruvate formate lyase activating enzyme
MDKDSVEIKGMEKASLVDYPGKVCAVVFLANCNFRCPYCQNPDLINQPDRLPSVDEQELFGLLKARGKWLDAVCITGGEPTMHAGLPGFAKRIKGLTQAKPASGHSDAGFLVKLDTNGSNPQMLKQLLDENLLDYVAMDIKGPLDRYAEAAGVPVDLRKIEESIGLIKNSDIDYEFRATVLPRLVSEQDLLKVGKWLAGSKRFAIQQFRPLNTLNPAYKDEKQYSPEELERFKKLLLPYFQEVEIRGV